jgi:uncharacterized DUF497 family protein
MHGPRRPAPGRLKLDRLSNYLYQVVVNEGGFEWDDAKAASNLVKHGVSFSYARTAFDDPASIETVDDRRDYGEERFNLIAKSPDNIVLFVTCAEHETGIRIISARRASKQEVKTYDEQ